MHTKARFLLSQSKVLEQYTLVNNLADTVSYSFKTNEEIGFVLQEQTDCFFSVHSVQSLRALKSTHIWFFAQGLTSNELDAVFAHGIFGMVIDNSADMSTLLSYLSKHQVTTNILLRMKLKEHTVHTGKHFVFGMASKKINELLPRLKDHDYVDKVGIHFHRKTQNTSEWNLLDELQESIQCWDCITYVNIGGGLPSMYKNFRSEVLPRIFEKITSLRTWLNKQNIQMIIEPGRFIAAPPVILETHIVNVYDSTIIVDASVFNAAMDTFVAHIRLLVDGEGKGTPYTIKGCTPDSMDIFRYKVLLKDPKPGDTISFLNAGAYTYSTDFCRLPKLETVIY